MNQSTEGMLRKASAIFGRGILLGLGFGISVGAIMYVMQKVEMQNVSGNVAEQLESGLDDLVLSNLEEHKEGSHDWILGTVTNNGKKAARGAQIEADLFKGGKFVDQYSTHVSGSLKPRESRNFKITCGCRDDAPAEHDSYKVKVTSVF